MVPLSDRLPQTVVIPGQVPPRHPGAVPVDDPFGHLTVIAERPRLPPRRRRQQRLNPGPLLIREHRVSTHTKTIPEALGQIRRHALAGLALLRFYPPVFAAVGTLFVLPSIVQGVEGGADRLVAPGACKKPQDPED